MCDTLGGSPHTKAVTATPMDTSPVDTAADPDPRSKGRGSFKRKITRKLVSIVGASLGSVILVVTEYLTSGGDDDVVENDYTVAPLPPLSPSPSLSSGAPPGRRGVTFGNGIARVSASGYTPGPLGEPQKFIPGKAFDGLPDTAWQVQTELNLKQQSAENRQSTVDWIATDIWLEVVLDRPRLIQEVTLATGKRLPPTPDLPDPFYEGAHLKRLRVVCELGTDKTEQVVEVTRHQRTLTLSNLNLTCQRILMKPEAVWLGQSSGDFSISEVEIVGEPA